MAAGFNIYEMIDRGIKNLDEEEREHLDTVMKAIKEAYIEYMKEVMSASKPEGEPPSEEEKSLV